MLKTHEWFRSFRQEASLAALTALAILQFDGLETSSVAFFVLELNLDGNEPGNDMSLEITCS